jgi:hypothetical protein
MGPHALHELAGGAGGMRHQLEHIGPGMESWWNDLGKPDITPDVIDRLVEAYQADRPPSVQVLATERDKLLLALLEALTRARQGIDEGKT